jgi:hypothetical protein
VLAEGGRDADVGQFSRREEQRGSHPARRHPCRAGLLRR